jgi:hypothetical protein
MRVPAFLGGGLGGLQNAGAWALAAAAAYAWQRHAYARDNGAAMTADERDAFNAARKRETKAAAAAAAPVAAAPSSAATGSASASAAEAATSRANS